MTTHDKIVDLATKIARYRLNNPSQRAGQAFMNVLSAEYPDLHSAVFISGVDPFYNDGLLPAAWGIVSQNI